MIDQKQNLKYYAVSSKTAVLVFIIFFLISFSLGVSIGRISSGNSFNQNDLLGLLLGKKTNNLENKDKEPTQRKTSDEYKKITDKDHIRGDKKANIVLIEYSDLECPFCKVFHTTLNQMLSTYGNKVMWIYRHFPLDSLHSKAREEAEATECAAKLGGEAKFWEFVDKIFEVTPSNNGLDPAMLPTIAEQIGINRDKFETCLSSGETSSIVESDYQSGLSAGVNGTPGSFILNLKTGNSETIPGAVPFDQLKNIIDRVSQ